MTSDHNPQPAPGPTGRRPAYDPRDALADVAASRGSVADRLVTPWWYHPILGALIAAIVLVNALHLSNLVKIVVAVASAAGMGLLVSAYQRLTGLWVDMRHLGPVSRRWWLAYAVVVAVVVAVPLLPAFTDRALPLWLAAVFTGTAFVATIVLGRRIDAAMREEIRAGRVAHTESR
ncbi:MAG TPA: hypothetical protein H9759_10545 [Candidatus Dietzia intestinipullorum]|nr:hypothetical protein [Candidatus Dietzia intestinipullorum]